MIKDTKYINQRRKLLMEMKTLIFKRLQVNKQIRKIQNDMICLDNLLIHGGKE